MSTQDGIIRVRISREVYAKLNEDAEKNNVTLSWLVRAIFNAYVRSKPVHIPIINFTGKGDEIGDALK